MEAYIGQDINPALVGASLVVALLLKARFSVPDDALVEEEESLPDAVGPASVRAPLSDLKPLLPATRLSSTPSNSTLTAGRRKSRTRSKRSAASKTRSSTIHSTKPPSQVPSIRRSPLRRDAPVFTPHLSTQRGSTSRSCKPRRPDVPVIHRSLRRDAPVFMPRSVPVQRTPVSIQAPAPLAPAPLPYFSTPPAPSPYPPTFFAPAPHLPAFAAPPPPMLHPGFSAPPPTYWCPPPATYPLPPLRPIAAQVYAPTLPDYWKPATRKPVELRNPADCAYIDPSCYAL
ncbi:hypothetical protein EIP91_006306 [Steccherinum ochraceum]|uniref:Uncharacterized protein n=1 Tax=Steccherinum ochraceum TaxID=92696 RepID=A0A4R0RM04_9APHY|nr:hypothetical protein EIP91_006306 [Steccherinum ochraceum]